MGRIFEFAALGSGGLAQDGGSPTYCLHQKLGDMRAQRQRINQLDPVANDILSSDVRHIRISTFVRSYRKVGRGEAQGAVFVEGTTIWLV